MKKIISILVIISLLFPTMAFADCDFSTGITKGSNDTYVYTKECHVRVGQMVQDVKDKDTKVNDLLQAITLKDLAITAADKRAQLWNDTSIKLEERIQKVDSLTSSNGVLYFSLGVLTTIATAWAIARVTR